MSDLCAICGRECPLVPIGSDVPIPFVQCTTTGRRAHLGCCEDYVLEFVFTTPGVLAAIRVMAMAGRADAVAYTDERPRRRH
jgi:hypothetical protein